MESLIAIGMVLAVAGVFLLTPIYACCVFLLAWSRPGAFKPVNGQLTVGLILALFDSLGLFLIGWGLNAINFTGQDHPEIACFFLAGLLYLGIAVLCGTTMGMSVRRIDREAQRDC